MKIDDFLRRICKGVDFGTAQFKVRWESEDKRFVIVTWPGKTAWSGRGQQKYYPSKHWIIDLDKMEMPEPKSEDGYRLLDGCKIKETEGRLTKDLLRNMRDLIDLYLVGIPI